MAILSMLGHGRDASGPFWTVLPALSAWALHRSTTLGYHSSSLLSREKSDLSSIASDLPRRASACASRPTVHGESHFRLWQRHFHPSNVHREEKRRQKLNCTRNRPAYRALVSSMENCRGRVGVFTSFGEHPSRVRTCWIRLPTVTEPGRETAGPKRRGLHCPTPLRIGRLPSPAKTPACCEGLKRAARPSAF
jgi:hypothetical protein